MFTAPHEKTLEVSYIERPSPGPRSQTCYRSLSISSISSYDYDDDDEEKPLVNPYSTLEDKAYEYNSYSSRPRSHIPPRPQRRSYTPCNECNTGKSPPRYVHVLYNSLNDKPLPPLPLPGQEERKRVVSFKLEKPLPPLPIENGLGSARRWW